VPILIDAQSARTALLSEELEGGGLPLSVVVRPARLRYLVPVALLRLAAVVNVAVALGAPHHRRGPLG